MGNKPQSESSSFGNSPATYAGVFAAISAALIRMLVPQEYIENSLTISAAISPPLGVFLFGYLRKKKRSDAQTAIESHIKGRMDFLDKQLADENYTPEQKSKFLQEKERLVLEYTQLDRTVD